METIWKFKVNTLDHGGILTMPDKAEILSLQAQREEICIWAKLNAEEPYRSRRINVYGTGQAHNAIQGKFIGTIQMYDGELILHVFDGGYIE